MRSLSLFAQCRVLLAVLLLTLVCSGCGDPVSVQVPDSAAGPAPTTPGGDTGVPAATTVATLVAVNPAVIQVGSQATGLTLSATGLGAGATVLVDGSARAVKLLSSTRAVVSLTRADVARGGRRSIALQNPGAAASNALTLLVTDGYRAFGDSITHGYTLHDPQTETYAALLAAAFHLSLTNSAVSGDKACDVWQQVYASGAGYDQAAAPLFTLMIGTNEANLYGQGAYQAVSRTCDLAVLSWLGTPRRAKVLAGDTASQASGGCTGTASSAALGGILCSGASGSVTAELVSGGNALYVWYLQSDAAGDTDGLAVTVDGVSAGTFLTRSTPRLALQNATAVAYGVVRLPVAAGKHTVQIQTRGMAGVLGVGSNPATGTDLPRLVVGDLPNQAYGAPVASIADQLAYVADSVANQDLLRADGMDVHRALTRNYMDGTVYEMSDQLHPNAVGHQKLAAAFAAAVP